MVERSTARNKQEHSVVMFSFEEQRLWDWAVGMAQHVAKLSKDPSSQVGAVIFDDKRRLVSAGYNGLPRGVEDTPARLRNRDTKYKMILHAERNAMAFATGSLEGATLFCTHPCCTQCAAQIIQMGIKHVCWPTPDRTFAERWAEDMVLSKEMFNEAGVTMHVR
jgi:dCMP deaminase